MNIFSPRVWLPAPQKGPKIEFFRQNFNFFNFFTNFYQKPQKIMEFYLFDGLESCASKFRAYLTKNQIFRPSGCRDWAQTLSRSSTFYFFHFFPPCCLRITIWIKGNWLFCDSWSLNMIRGFISFKYHQKTMKLAPSKIHNTKDKILSFYLLSGWCLKSEEV